MDKTNPNLGDIKNAKIIKVEFSQRPKSHSSRTCESSYVVDSGSIKLVLNNGLDLIFWNSEWGGMNIISDAGSRIGDHDYIDYTNEDLEDVL